MTKAREREATKSIDRSREHQSAEAILSISVDGRVEAAPVRAAHPSDREFAAALQQVLSTRFPKKRSVIAPLKGFSIPVTQVDFYQTGMSEFAAELVRGLTELGKGNAVSSPITFGPLSRIGEERYRGQVREKDKKGVQNPIEAIRELDLSNLAPPPIPPQIVALEKYMKQVQAGPILPREQREAFVKAVNDQLSQAGYRLVLQDGRFAKLSIVNGAIQIQPTDRGTIGFKKNVQFALRPYVRAPRSKGAL